jgi:hypothetical protein
MTVPFLSRGMVLSHDPDNDGIVVMLQSGQMPVYTVKRIYHGLVDAYRINKPPLPTRGSWGLIAFPGGDVRNATWLGSYQPHKIDAITSEQDDPFADYQAHFSGHWSHLHGVSGYLATQFADGSFFVAGSGISLPTMHRHVVGDQQKRERIEYPFSDRAPNPQKTFSYSFNQSGTNFTATLDPSGNLNVLFDQGKSLTFQQSGTSATIVIDGSGNITVNAAQTITYNAPASMAFITPVATFSSAVHVSGEIVRGYGSFDQVTLGLHQHKQGTDTHGDTEQDTMPPTPGT